MVETQEIRDAFAARLHQALDSKEGVRKGRGRNTDLHSGLKASGVITTTQATNKWLRGESMPEKDKMRHLAAWLGVPAQWLEYGEVSGQETDNAPAPPLLRAYEQASSTDRAIVDLLLGLTSKPAWLDDAALMALRSLRAAVEEASVKSSAPQAMDQTCVG